MSRDPIEERGGPNLLGFVLNSPLYWLEYLGLGLSLPWDPVEPEKPWKPGDDPWRPEPGPVDDPFDGSGYGGGETHFIVGSGFSRVTCCDENDTKHIMWYRKICIGAAVGFGIGGGDVVGMDGANCRKENYEGWFFELGLMPGLGGGVDIGYRDLWPDNERNPLPPLPGCTSGVNEWGVGCGVGVELKAT